MGDFEPQPPKRSSKLPTDPAELRSSLDQVPLEQDPLCIKDAKPRRQLGEDAG